MKMRDSHKVSLFMQAGNNASSKPYCAFFNFARYSYLALNVFLVFSFFAYISLMKVVNSQLLDSQLIVLYRMTQLITHLFSVLLPI